MKIRTLTRDDLDTVLDWAAAEGWNPGMSDADAFWASDAQGFIGAEVDGQLVGSGAMVSYGGRMGFVGLFIVRPEFRGLGYGKALWQHMMRELPERLDPGAPVALDGVKAMESTYRESGFETVHDDIRMRIVTKASQRPPGVRGITAPAGSLGQFDATCFGVPRPQFLTTWLGRPEHISMALVRDRLLGYGVLRPCRTGYKVGPLFTEDVRAAADLLDGLFSEVPAGSEVFLDVPSANATAVQLAKDLGGHEVFRCARMYRGRPPATDWSRVFGVTTLELG